MRWCFSRAAAVLSLVIGASAQAETGRAALGAAIFGGTADQLENAAAIRQVARLPCKSCHGADGRGAEEGRAPPIEGPALIQTTADRPAYDRSTFAVALRQGRSASGRVLNRLMPRYELTDAEVSALFDHLANLPKLQRIGVTESSVTFGIPAGNDREGALYLRHLRQAMAEHLGGDVVHGRQVTFMPLFGSSQQADAPIFAALSVPVAWLPAYTAAGLPVVFPFGGLKGDEDPALVRDFLPSAADIRRALANHVASQATGAVAIVPPGAGAEALATSLRLAGGVVASAATSADTQEMIVLTADALPSALVQAPKARIWLDRRVLAKAGGLPASRVAVVYTGMAALIAGPDVPPIEAHARLAGRLLAETLLEAGRDLTRAGLLRAFGAAYLSDLGLDYRAHPLTGGAALRFDALGARKP